MKQDRRRKNLAIALSVFERFADTKANGSVTVHFLGGEAQHSVVDLHAVLKTFDPKSPKSDEEIRRKLAKLFDVAGSAE